MLITELSPSQIEEVQRATEEVLATIGCRVTHPEALRRCRQAGARNFHFPTGKSKYCG